MAILMTFFTGRIYLISNNVTNKKYVGQTIQKSIKTRWNQHLYVARVNANRSAIAAAIKKYGQEAFTIEVLENRASDQTELNLLEEAYISILNTLAPNGYNLKSSSDGKGTLNQSTREKMSKAHLGRKFSDSHLANIRAANKRRVYTVSPEVRKQMSLAHKGKPHRALYKDTIIYNTITKELQYFSSIGQAASYMGCTPSNATGSINGKVKLIKGRYIVYLLQSLVNS